jgi:peptide deformylase
MTEGNIICLRKRVFMNSTLLQFFNNAPKVAEQIPELTFLGDDILKTKTIFTNFETALKVCEDLTKTLIKMREITGIGRGLAAVQIGSNERCFITFVDNEFQYFINPKITKYSNNTNWYRENCLSCGPITCNLNRSENITLKFIDKEGNTQEKIYDQFWARLLQHEYDHLEGVVNITKTKPEDIELLKRSPLEEKLQESNEQA